MTLGAYLRRLLAEDAGVVALAVGRIYTEVLPQNGVLPALVFTEVAGDNDLDLEGPSGVGSRRMQVDAWAKTRAEATALGLVVRALLDGHTGGAAGLDIQGIFHLTERWDFEAETKLFRTSQDYEVWTGGVEA